MATEIDFNKPFWLKTSQFSAKHDFSMGVPYRAVCAMYDKNNQVWLDVVPWDNAHKFSDGNWDDRPILREVHLTKFEDQNTPGVVD